MEKNLTKNYEAISNVAIIGTGNAAYEHFKCLKKLNYFREKLSKKDRSTKPCDKCSINSSSHEKKSFDILKKHLNL